MNIEIPDGPFSASSYWNIDSGNSWIVQIMAWGEIIFEVDVPDALGPGTALVEGERIFAQRLRKLLESA